MLTATTGILTNEVNVGFTPEGKYLTAGNDVVDLSKWNGSGSVNIGDAFSNDNDKVTVMAKNLAAGADLKLTSIENLEIVNAGVTDPVILNGANFKGLEAIKLIGDATTLNVSDFTQGIKVDATTNADSIIGSNKADTINGGAGNDTIVGNGGDDVLTGGNGADEFVVGTVKDAGVDQILDFSAEDKISMEGFVPNELKKFDASTFSTVTYKTLDSVLATFATGGANATKDGDVVIFSYDGKTYALLANGAFNEATDALVDITGANVASLTESNFGAFTSQYNYASVTAFNEAAAQGLIPVNTATITVGSGDAALKTTDIQYIKDGGISGATVSIALQGSGVVTFDATSNDFVAKFASKAPALNISGTSENDSIIAPSFGGTINGNAGDDTIDASAAIGAVTITGGEGADTIIGGSGNDTIVLTESSSASDVVVFAATAAANGMDTITGFTAGSSKDVLNVSAFVGTVTSKIQTDGSGSGSVIDKAVLVDKENNVVADAAAAKALFSTNSSDSGSKYVVQSGQKLFFIDSGSSSAASGDKMFYVEVVGTEITVTQVGVLGATTSAAWHADNFA